MQAYVHQDLKDVLNARVNTRNNQYSAWLAHARLPSSMHNTYRDYKHTHKFDTAVARAGQYLLCQSSTHKHMYL